MKNLFLHYKTLAKHNVAFFFVTALATGSLFASNHFSHCPNANDYFGPQARYQITNLHVAAASGDAHTVACMIRQPGVNLNPVDRFGDMPIHAAAQARRTQNRSHSGHIEVIALLIQAGVSIDTPDGDGQDTALHWASRFGFEEVARFLIQNGADIHIRNKLEQTPLHLTTIRKKNQQGKILIAELLLQLGAEVNAKDYLNRTPYFYAYYAYNLHHLANLLRSHGGRR